MFRTVFPLAWLMALVVALSHPLPASAQGNDEPQVNEEASGHWEDFIHYGRIGRADLAASHGRALVRMDLPPRQLLAVIEASPYADDWQRTVNTLRRMTGDNVEDTNIQQVARDVVQAVEAAKRAVIRDPQRIREQIDLLDEGLRPQANATRRLREAGQYAVPQMVRVLLTEDDWDETHRPFVMEAMVEMGRSVVIPLAESMRGLTAPARQDAARILGRIGYGGALPFLKELIDDPETSDATRRAMREAFDRIAGQRGVSPDTAAAQLFHLLAEDYYRRRDSLILEPEAEHNLQWTLDEDLNLRPLEVPTAIYPYTMAMRMNRQALRLDADLAPALSLWLASNFQRANRLPGGATDPTYGSAMRSPAFYARLAGITHIRPVLSRGLADRDADLALDAIDAMAVTAGSESLLADPGPLVDALYYPDRRVRFEAALAITRAEPEAGFVGAGRVVPVLAEAVRQTGQLIAVVIAPDQPARNELGAMVRQAGNYDVILGRSLSDLAERMETLPGADLVVIQGDLQAVAAFDADRHAEYKVRNAPMAVLAERGSVSGLRSRYDQREDIVITPADADPAALGAAIDQARSALRGADISDRRAEAYALSALGMLRDLALRDGAIFDVAVAQPSLIEALQDDRPAVAGQAGGVLAHLPGERSQQALAEAALNDGRSTDLRVAWFGHLAEHAKTHGALITDRQESDLLSLIEQAEGQLADAAARAHGALNLPTSNSVEFITGE